MDAKWRQAMPWVKHYIECRKRPYISGEAEQHIDFVHEQGSAM